MCMTSFRELYEISPIFSLIGSISKHDSNLNGDVLRIISSPDNVQERPRSVSNVTESIYTSSWRRELAEKWEPVY